MRTKWEVRKWERQGWKNSGCLASRGRGGRSGSSRKEHEGGEKLYFSKMRDLTLFLLKEDWWGKNIRTYGQLGLNIPVEFHKTFEHWVVVKTMEWMQRERAFKAEGAANKEFPASLFSKQSLTILCQAHPLVWVSSGFWNMVSQIVIRALCIWIPWALGKNAEGSQGSCFFFY